MLSKKNSLRWSPHNFLQLSFSWQLFIGLLVKFPMYMLNYLWTNYLIQSAHLLRLHNWPSSQYSMRVLAQACRKWSVWEFPDDVSIGQIPWQQEQPDWYIRHLARVTGTLWTCDQLSCRRRLFNFGLLALSLILLLINILLIKRNPRQSSFWTRVWTWVWCSTSPCGHRIRHKIWTEFYGNRRVFFFSIFKNAHHWSISRTNKIHFVPTIFRKAHFVTMLFMSRYLWWPVPFRIAG